MNYYYNYNFHHDRIKIERCGRLFEHGHNDFLACIHSYTVPSRILGLTYFDQWEKANIMQADGWKVLAHWYLPSLATLCIPLTTTWRSLGKSTKWWDRHTWPDTVVTQPPAKTLASGTNQVTAQATQHFREATLYHPINSWSTRNHRCMREASRGEPSWARPEELPRWVTESWAKWDVYGWLVAQQKLIN